ncbi:MAG: hypothetical protein IJB27_00175 [Clostridia bacterium]|nr:hypothetical protein [Clostridia bacterium]
MTRRKIAFWSAVGATLLLAVLRIKEIPVLPHLTVFGMEMPVVCSVLFGIAAVAVLALFISRKPTPTQPHSGWSTPCGWIATFGGAVMALTAVTDVFAIETMFDQNHEPTAMDLTLAASVIAFEVLGGLYLVLLGFRWMSAKTADSTLLKWLSLCPALWMWFRLARYEISYASTIDISKNFFDFATLVFASLFFLQFARAMSGIGKKPHNGLPILALCTAMTSISSIPATISHLVVTNNVSNLSIHDLMTVIVDGVIGLTALVFAAMQVFSKAHEAEPVATTENADAPTAWSEPQKPYDPLDPPFSPDQLLPTLEPKVECVPEVRDEETTVPAPSVEPLPDVQPTDATPPSIDDLLAEIEDEQNTLQ